MHTCMGIYIYMSNVRKHMCMHKFKYACVRACVRLLIWFHEGCMRM